MPWGSTGGVPNWWLVCYDQVQQLPRYGLIMMSDFLSRAVTLEAVTPAFLTWSLALLSLLSFSVQAEEIGAGGELWHWE
jgi:hypothetical protein